jgi:hypothetical protein
MGDADEVRQLREEHLVVGPLRRLGTFPTRNKRFDGIFSSYRDFIHAALDSWGSGKSRQAKKEPPGKLQLLAPFLKSQMELPIQPLRQVAFGFYQRLGKNDI